MSECEELNAPRRNAPQLDRKDAVARNEAANRRFAPQLAHASSSISTDASHRSLPSSSPEIDCNALKSFDNFQNDFWGKKRVGAVITHNDMGGAQQAIIRLSTELQKRDHQLELAFLYRRGSLVPSKLDWRFILDCEEPSILNYAFLPFRLARWIQHFRPDVLISFLPLANVVAQTTAALCGVPTRIASQRNPVSSYSWPMRLLDLYSGTFGSYSHNIVNSSDVEHSIENYPFPYRFRTRLVYNGVPRFVEKIDRDKVRSQYRLGKDKIALVSIGRLTKQKNHVFLIQLLGVLDNFVLLIAGDGPEHGVLCQEADRMGVGHRLRMLGELDRKSTSELLVAADIFAIPSIFEGQSNSLLEAMAAGKPIIASDLTCNRETLGDGDEGAGFVISTTEPDRWVSILLALGQDKTLCEIYSERARCRADLFSLERMCSGFEACFLKRA